MSAYSISFFYYIHVVLRASRYAGGDCDLELYITLLLHGVMASIFIVVLGQRQYRVNFVVI